MARQIHIAISDTKLAELIMAGHLCAADLQCLDRESKQALWQLCLWSCAKRNQCRHCLKKCGMAAQLPEVVTALFESTANRDNQ
ncbi:hypothetical protein PY479_11805 [Shewanella sp. A32]|uniref:hypothetical protein n=1 Tax=Shewanella sp. A32 TaxID=3031327 RepID=UPI0023B8E271|nr:hypothetical protein [Shewanella sp. A32]MDF0534957.1 hypothetical protein [Shewanella sp. A32]